ncbi:hypothetical protein BJX62DRAFT_26757 [Aspergillus germanicus]
MNIPPLISKAFVLNGCLGPCTLYTRTVLIISAGFVFFAKRACFYCFLSVPNSGGIFYSILSKIGIFLVLLEWTSASLHIFRKVSKSSLLAE